MEAIRLKINAIIEVSIIFLSIIFIFKLISAASLGIFEKELANKNFIQYIIVAAIPLLLIFLRNKKLSEYGITAGNIKNNFKIAALCSIPIAVISVSLFFFNWKNWDGAIIVSIIEIILFFIIAYILKDRPEMGYQNKYYAISILLAMSIPTLDNMVVNTVLSFIYFFIFVGPAEEILFRGYIQTRLNEVFGRPYRFLGISIGLGLFIASLFFGLWHVFNYFDPFTGKMGIAWEWGLWTLFAGLIFGLIREKTGNIFAPSILHGILNFL
jgi:hypothetical protein